jgi:hypothetical protein
MALDPYRNTPDRDLVYRGDDFIVWDRINAERLRRGLPGLAAIGMPRPVESPGPATDSSGAIVTEASAAQVPNANSSNPPLPPGVIDSSGAIIPAPGQDPLTNAQSNVEIPPEGLPVPPTLESTTPNGSTTGTNGGTGGSAAGVGTSALQPAQVSTALQSYIYKATKVVSRFRNGAFTQDLEGVLMIFPDSVLAAASQENTKESQTQVAGAVAPDQSTAETQRLQAAARSQPQNNNLERGSVGDRALGALGSTNVDFSGSEFGAFFDSGSTSSLVNYKPADLAGVIDRGVGAAVPSALTSQGFTSPTDIARAASTVSNGSIVSLPGLQDFNLPSIGIQVVLENGQTISVNSAQQIQGLVSQGQLSQVKASAAIVSLQALTAAQQRPLTTTQQVMRKDD